MLKTAPKTLLFEVPVLVKCFRDLFSTSQLLSQHKTSGNVEFQSWIQMFEILDPSQRFLKMTALLMALSADRPFRVQNGYRSTQSSPVLADCSLSDHRLMTLFAR